MISKILFFGFTAFLTSSVVPANGARRIVNNMQELQNAVDSVAPGDTIQLAPKVFEGELIITKNGPATITGDTNSTIKSLGTSGITVRGNQWSIKSLKITEPGTGVLIEGGDNSLNNVVIQKVDTGILVKGEGNTIKSCVISEASGGIFIAASNNKLHYNSVNIQTPSITLEEGTCCGFLEANVANGRVDIKGDNYELVGNVANHGMYVSGCENSFQGNVANGASFPESCSSKDLGGNVYRGVVSGDTGAPLPQPDQSQQTAGTSVNNNGQGFIPQNTFSGQIVPTSVKTNNNGKTPQCTCTCV